MVSAACLFLSWPAIAEKPTPETLRAWEGYVAQAEQRIAAEQQETEGAVRAVSAQPVRSESIRVIDGLIHHARGSVFVPGVSLASALRWMQRYDDHHRYFREVTQSRLLAREGDTFRVFYRLVRENSFLAAHYNTEHTVVYRQRAVGHASGRSVATRIAEIVNPGTAAEVERPVGDDSGYLWRLNSYWRYTERDGGVMIECESVSLSRALPYGLAWLIRGYVAGIPRDSLQSTLRSVREGVVAARRND